jgi:hypothetical protein
MFQATSGDNHPRAFYDYNDDLGLLMGIGQETGFKNIRPYARNAISRPITLFKMMGVVSRYFTCTQTNKRLSTAKIAAARTISCGCQWRAAGTMSPTAHASSRIPRTIHAFRGNAPKLGTSWLTLSNKKTFMTPDDPYRSAARTCRTQNNIFMMYPEFPISSPNEILFVLRESRANYSSLERDGNEKNCRAKHKRSL